MTFRKILAMMLVGAPALEAATFLYQADLTPGAVVPGEPADDPDGISTATGTALLTLTTGGDDGPTLSYELVFEGLDVSEMIPRPTLSGPDNLIRAIHIHFGSTGTNGGHALNIYGFPREDDADISVSTIDSRVSGLWDDGDENLGPDGVLGSGDSVALSDALSALQAGDLYFQAHTMGFRAGELRGQILPVPEPSALTLSLFAGSLVWRRRR